VGRADPNFYRFRTCWELAAPADGVFAVLEDPLDYPRWWPEIRAARPVGDLQCEVACRSFLPIELRFVITHARRDPDLGVLEATMTGDLEGFSRWTVGGTPVGTRVVFEEEVVATKAVLRRFAPVGRPIFRANHTLMMRRGGAGLRARMAERQPTVDSRRSDTG